MDSENNTWHRPFNANVNLLRGLVDDMFKDGRVTSAAFKDFECSTDRDDLRKVEDTLGSNNNFKGVGKVNSAYPESLNSDFPKEFHQKLIHQPNPGNPSHCLIMGKKSKALARRLARASILILRTSSVP